MPATRTRRSERSTPPIPVTTAPTDAPVIPVRPAMHSINDVFERTEPTPTQIRERAYFLYLARGGQPGSPEGDWLQAERELREESGLPSRVS